MMNQPDTPVPFCDRCAYEVHSIFKHLTKDEADELNYLKEFRTFKKGAVLYREGNRINGFYCINKGIIKVYKTGPDGKEQIIRFAKPGDIIAYRSVLSNETACTTAKVLEESFVCFFPSEVLPGLVRRNSNFALELVKLICEELGEANSYITDIAQKTVRERLAEVLLKLVAEFGLDENNQLKISLTREELANIVGTATESVIRLLSEFKANKLVDLSGRRVRILNPRGLEKISKFSPG